MGHAAYPSTRSERQIAALCVRSVWTPGSGLPELTVNRAASGPALSFRPEGWHDGSAVAAAKKAYAAGQELK